MAFKGDITESELEDLAASKLRLFLSVDVVGSTAFKHQTKKSDPQGWLDFFTSFYTEFPEFFLEAREHLLTQERRSSLPGAPLWKAIGDELVFVTVLKHRSEAELHLSAFRRAVNHAVTEFAHVRKLPVSFKASAWLSGFPVGNATIPTDQPQTGGQVPFDFVGPAIDLGFRLGSFATPRRFIISVELAYLILVARGNHPKLFYEGKSSLKGVLSGCGYPIIWIDNYDDIPEEDQRPEHRLTALEDSLLVRNRSNDDELRDFCREFIVEIGHPLILPFIVGDLDPPLTKPEGYDTDLEKVEKRLREVFNVIPDSDSSENETEAPIDELEHWELRKPAKAKKKSPGKKTVAKKTRPKLKRKKSGE